MITQHYRTVYPQPPYCGCSSRRTYPSPPAIPTSTTHRKNSEQRELAGLSLACSSVRAAGIDSSARQILSLQPNADSACFCRVCMEEFVVELFRSCSAYSRALLCSGSLDSAPVMSVMQQDRKRKDSISTGRLERARLQSGGHYNIGSVVPYHLPWSQKYDFHERSDITSPFTSAIHCSASWSCLTCCLIPIIRSVVFRRFCSFLGSV
jgi:hypothetical protein